MKHLIFLTLTILIALVSTPTDASDFTKTANEKPVLSDSLSHGYYKKSAIKTNLIMPLIDATSLSFEHSIKSGRSYELELGLIGDGLNIIGLNKRGAFFSIGYKFIKISKKRIGNNSNCLRGLYFKPELGAGRYLREFEEKYAYGEYNNGRDKLYSYRTNSEIVNTFSFQFTIGRQWVISNVFLIDTFGSLGYGNASNNRDALHFHFAGGYDEFPIAFNLGLKIGLMLKPNKIRNIYKQ